MKRTGFEKSNISILRSSMNCGFVVLLLTGCARETHRLQLEVYGRDELPPFARETLNWTAEARPERGDAEIPELTAETVAQADRATTPPESVRIEVIASVTGLPRETVRAAIESAKPVPAETGPLNWGDLALAVAMNNPGVEAARAQWQSTLMQFSQADFLEAIVNQFRALMGDDGPGMMQEAVPYPSAVAFKGEMIREQARRAKLQWELALREALVAAGEAYFEIQELRRAEASAAENVALIEDLGEVVAQRYRAGEAEQADLLRAQTMLERERNRLLDLRAGEATARARINAFLGRAADAPLGTPDDDDLPDRAPAADALTSAALTARQEVGIAEAERAMTAIAIRMGEVMNRPRASALGNIEARPAYAQAEAYLGELRERLRAADAEVAQARADARADAVGWSREHDVARRAVALLRDVVVPQSRSAHESALSAYQAGRISFVDLLDAERELIAARLELDTARGELNRALVRRARVTGRISDFE
jgi:hypothetical protein